MTSAEYSKAWYAANRDRERVKRKAYYARMKDNPTFIEQRRRATREWARRQSTEERLACKYKTTVECITALLARGQCDICHTTERLGIDHCHDTGAVRGLLCQACNAGIGQFRDSRDLLAKASEYLENTTQNRP